MSPPLPAFCSNLLPAEDFVPLCHSLVDFAAAVRERSGCAQIGVDLRLGSSAIQQAQSPDVCQRWRDRLGAAGIRITSLNAFPLRPFQAAVVKDDAYRPDWGQRERVEASIAAIAIADALTDPDDELCSISTLPGSYLPWGEGAALPRLMAQHLGEWVAAAAIHQQSGGRRVVLAIEPEPCCSLGSSTALAAFWLEQRATMITAAAEQLGAQAEAALGHHIALCWDTCHASVMHEDQEQALSHLASLGLLPLKVQYSAAPMSSGPVTEATISDILALAEPRFCHQVGLRQGTTTSTLADIPDLAAAAAPWRAGQQPYPDSVRTHFHIPVHRELPSTTLSSSEGESRRGLQAALALGARHVSVETYTWSLFAAVGDDPLAGTAAEVHHLSGLLASLGH